MERLLQDLKLAARILWKDRGFAVTALLTLGICIGANAAIFAIVNSVLLRPLPVPEAGQLVHMYNAYPAAGAVLAAEPLLPRGVREDGLLRLPDFAVFLREDTSASGVDLQKSQQGRRRNHRDDTLGLRLSAERHTTGVVERLFLEDARFLEAIVVIRHAGRAPGDASGRVGVVHVDELARLRHRQRP
jgi:hypothetical protein